MKISPTILSLFLIIIAAVFSTNGSHVTVGKGKMAAKVPHGNVDAIHKKEVKKEGLSAKHHIDDKSKEMTKNVMASTTKKVADNKKGKMKKPRKMPQKLQHESSKLATINKNSKKHSPAKNNSLKSFKNEKATRRQFCYENCRKPAASAIHHQKHQMLHRIAAVRQKRALIECNQCNNEFDDAEFDACPNCDPAAINIGGGVTSESEENREEVDGTRIEEVDNDYDSPGSDSGEDVQQSDSLAGSDNDNNNDDSDDEDEEPQYFSDVTDSDGW